MSSTMAISGLSIAVHDRPRPARAVRRRTPAIAQSQLSGGSAATSRTSSTIGMPGCQSGSVSSVSIAFKNSVKVGQFLLVLGAKIEDTEGQTDAVVKEQPQPASESFRSLVEPIHERRQRSPSPPSAAVIKLWLHSTGDASSGRKAPIFLVHLPAAEDSIDPCVRSRGRWPSAACRWLRR
jgi:hypothetical protein